MKRETLTISLPAGMAAQVREASHAEYRTNSELVREALRQYLMDRLPVATASASESKAIAKGRAEIGAGQVTSLNKVKNGLGSRNRKVSRKKTS